MNLTASQQRELQRYQTDRVLTATPGQLIAMMLERSIADLEAAETEPSQAERSVLIRHAQDIVVELRCALDFSQGEIATNLDNLYDFVEQRCLDSFLSGDPSELRAAISVLVDIHEGWKAIL